MQTEKKIRAGGSRVLMVVLALLSASVVGEEMGPHIERLGVIEADSKAAYVAGIGHLMLEREGDVESEWIYRAEVFDLESQPLGQVELQLPDGLDHDARELTFTRADGSATYRFRGDREFSEFENVGVEGFSLTRNCDPDQIEAPLEQLQCMVEPAGCEGNEAYEAWAKERQDCWFDVTMTGAFPTIEAALAVYGEIYDFMGAAGAEIERHLGKHELKLERQRLRLRLDAQSNQSGGLDLMKNMDKSFIPPVGTCPPGMRLACPVSLDPSSGNIVPGSGFHPFSPTTCCTRASSDADVNCQLYGPRLECCANTFCQVSCGVGCGCSLFGFHYVCLPYCS